MIPHFVKHLNFLQYKFVLCKYRNRISWKSTFRKENKVQSNSHFKFTVGEVAKMADGCCIANLGNTSVMATAVSSKEKTSLSSFIPLQVDYRQKYSAAGRIPTNHKRRELGQSDKEILISRAIDRSVRPLFPKGFSSEVQVSCNPIAIDHINDPDVVGINAASAALTVSNIPWNGPIGAVRVGLVDNEVVINPSRKDMSKTALNLIVTATDQNKVVMMEGMASHVPEDKFLEAVELGVDAAQLVIKSINELQKIFGKPKTVYDPHLYPPFEVLESTTLLCEAKITDILSNYNLNEIDRGKAIDVVTQEVIAKLKANYAECEPSILYEAINTVIKDTFRDLILETEKRCDGRSITDLREIFCEINKFESLHGCAVFERGQTQVFCTVAFDSIQAAIRNDPYFELPNEEDKTFMLHYEFPPYATNEIGHVGKFGRREIGHGALAENSLRCVLPSKFPFTIRLTSDVLASNGSSSMATVCGGSLALMDAGVPISTPVAGLAMGLISVPDAKNNHDIVNYKILTDLLGMEDSFGDMDFKIAGSRNGITAVQLDIKIPGLPLNIIEDTLYQSKDAKIKILDVMDETISKPREERKKNWPVSENLEIPIHKLSRFVGKGGINLKDIFSKTGVRLIYRENGIFYLFAPNSEAWMEAKEIIDKLLDEKKPPELIPEKIYSATIVEIKDSGVMVTLYDGMEPTFVRDSFLSTARIKSPAALEFQVGQKIDLQYFGRNPASGELRLIRRTMGRIS